MKRKIKFNLLLAGMGLRKICVLLFFSGFFHFAFSKNGSEVRGNFLCSISSEIQWPVSNRSDQFKLVLLGATPGLYYALEESCSAIHLNGKPINIRQLNQLEDVGNCQLLFVTNPEIYNWQELIKVCNQRKIFLITEGINAPGSMLNFIVVNGEVKYKLNISWIEENGFVLSEQAKKDAINDDNDWKNLQAIIKTETEEERKKVREWEYELQSLAIALDEQRKLLNRQRDSISRQEAVLKAMKKDLLEKEMRVKDFTDSINISRDIFVLVKERLLHQKEELRRQKKIATGQQYMIKGQDEILQQKRKELKLKEKEIRLKREELKNKHLVIESQESIIGIGIVIGVFILIILFLLLFFFRKQQKLSRDLEEARDTLEEKVQQRTNELNILNSELEENIRKLQITNDRLEEFAYVATHNLRSPSLNLKTLIELLLKEKHPGKTKDEMAQMVFKNLDHLLNILTDLTDLILTTENQDETMNTVNINELTEQVLAQFSEKIKRNKVKIVKQFKVTEITYVRLHLWSILSNLISNAIKYSTSERTPEITLRSYKYNDMICLEVTDNGIGINLKKYGNKLFKLYQRLDLSKEGKGIGLNIIKNQIESLGGEIHVKSQLGKGSTFSVYIKDFS